MSELERLIQELCPNGVEYKSVGAVCDTITDYTAAGSFADIAKNVQYINNGKGFAQLVTALFSVMFLKERISSKKELGILLIVIGLFIVCF